NNQTVIDAKGLDRVFQVFSGFNVTLSGVVLQGGTVTGAPAQGGGIYNAGTLTLLNAAVVSVQALSSPGAEAQRGGCYNAAGATLTLNGTLVSGTATGGKGPDGLNGTDGANATTPGQNGTSGTSGTAGGNGAAAFGGGIYNNGGTVVVTNFSQVNGSANG